MVSIWSLRLRFSIFILLWVGPLLQLQYWPWSSYPMYASKLELESMYYYETVDVSDQIDRRVSFTKMESRRLSYLLIQSNFHNLSKLERKIVLAKYLKPLIRKTDTSHKFKIIIYSCGDQPAFCLRTKKETIEETL